jgi:hypothetical protein
MVDLQVCLSSYECCCQDCRDHPKGTVALDHQAINRILAMLDERQRRLLAGLLAMRRGHGGILRVAEITGLSRTTIRRGIEELQRGIGPGQERIRRPGGGRKRLEKKTQAW